MVLRRQSWSGGLDVWVEQRKGGHNSEVTLPLRMRIWRWKGIRIRSSSMHRLWTSTINLQRFVSNRWSGIKLRKIWYIEDTGILLKGILGNVFNKYNILRNVGLTSRWIIAWKSLMFITVTQEYTFSCLLGKLISFYRWKMDKAKTTKSVQLRVIGWFVESKGECWKSLTSHIAQVMGLTCLHIPVWASHLWA